MMIALCLLHLGEAKPAPVSVREDVKISYARPSRLLKRINLVPDNALKSGQPQHLLAPSLVKQVSDEKGVITLCGSKEDIDSAKQIIALFDVQPRDVTVSVTIRSQIDHFVMDSKTTVPNNTAWTISADEPSLKAKLIPRMNDDGTITVSLDMSLDGKAIRVVTRIKHGESTDLVGLKALPNGLSVSVSADSAAK